MQADLIPAATPKFSYIHSMRSMFIICIILYKVLKFVGDINFVPIVQLINLGVSTWPQMLVISIKSRFVTRLVQDVVNIGKRLF